MKVKKYRRQGCGLYVPEEVNEGKGPCRDQYPIFSEVKDVFLRVFPGLPSERKIDFTIKLKPGAETISKTLYRMMAPKICELTI
jgi:hypothetical protein